MTDHDGSLVAQALYTIRAGTEEERRVAAGFLHSELQAASDRALESMARSMFEGLDRALSRGDDAAEENQMRRDVR